MSNMYQGTFIQVINAQPGQKIQVVVAPSNPNDQIAWCSGPEFGNGEIQIDAPPGVIPISMFAMTSSTIEFYTSDVESSGGSQIVLGAYLVATAGTQTFTLQAANDPNVQVYVSISNSAPQLVSSTPTPFPYSPQ